jgi:hypothetical protein
MALCVRKNKFLPFKSKKNKISICQRGANFYMEKAKKTKRVPYDSGLDSFPANLSIEYVNEQKKKHKEKLVKSQEKLLRIERKRFLGEIDFATRHDIEHFTFTPKDLDDKHKLILVQEIMDKFDGRVFGEDLRVYDDYTGNDHVYIHLIEPKVYTTYKIRLD